MAIEAGLWEYKQLEENPLYYITKCGKIISNVHKCLRVLTQTVAGRGYYMVSLGGGKHYTVHRLLGKYFLNGYKKDLIINHINGIKTDNRLTNLAWVTLQQNSKHAHQLGLSKSTFQPGTLPSNTKLTPNNVQWVKENIGIFTQKEMSTQLNVHLTTINKLIKGYTWKEKKQ